MTTQAIDPAFTFLRLIKVTVTIVSPAFSTTCINTDFCAHLVGLLPACLAAARSMAPKPPLPPLSPPVHSRTRVGAGSLCERMNAQGFEYEQMVQTAAHQEEWNN